ncbi:MAG: hypothetical protein A2X77_00340 [Gammaproteobacteria bacterium GWE2_42_36]|nr:MAG: hypothetical protein A2X77_00340 [Gammaproteobacteria bacterium GWE2_42_36]HCU05262.1 hypothetical protein [Coxiellaceae bacterium]
MNMLTRNLIYIVFAIALFFIGYELFHSSQRPPLKTDLILYYSANCPHCATVKEFIYSHNIAQKTHLVMKEITHSRDNLTEYLTVAKRCNLSSNDLVVPLLWAQQTCYIGVQPIIDFFNKTPSENL